MTMPIQEGSKKLQKKYDFYLGRIFLYLGGDHI